MPFTAVGSSMKKALLIAMLVFLPFSASAEDNVMNLPGNAKVMTDGNNGRYVYRGYDTEELIKRRLLGYDDQFYYRRNNNIPRNEFSDVCSGADRASERRRCRREALELDKDRAELYRKYNN